MQAPSRASTTGFRCLLKFSDVWFQHAPLSMHMMIRDLAALVRWEEAVELDDLEDMTSAAEMNLLRCVLVKKKGFQMWLEAQGRMENNAA